MARKPEEKPPSFFNILLDADFADTLKSPCDFVNKYLNGELIEKPLLKTDRSSEPWPVGMEKIGQDYYFRMGWSDFVKDNNLERADFLLFWLISDSTFFVTVYDPTCCEKPFEIPSSPSSSCSLSDSEHKKNICTNDKNVRTYEESSGINTRNPYGEAKITRSLWTRIHLPMGFVRETKTLLTRQNIVLRNEEGKKWRVETYLRMNGLCYELAWGDFRKENNIKESDVCSFEFRHDEGDLIDVRVLERNKKKATSKWNIRGKIWAMKYETNGAKPKNPCLEVIITKSNKRRMYLGMSFARETGLLKRKGVVLRDEEGRHWRVDTYLRNGRSFELTKGWQQFQKMNGLKESDVCLFEFCREEGSLINVRVLHSNEKKMEKETSLKVQNGQLGVKARPAVPKE